MNFVTNKKSNIPGNNMEDLRSEWNKVITFCKDKVEKNPDMNGVLFLVGIRERGLGPGNFTKEQKQDLMNLALCRVLSRSGYFEETETDNDGWPHFQQSKPFPKMGVVGQEKFIKEHLIMYFKDEELI